MPTKTDSSTDRSPSTIISEEHAAMEIFDDLIAEYLTGELAQRLFQTFFRLKRRGARWSDVFNLFDAEVKLLKAEHLSQEQQITEIQKTLSEHIEIRPAILDRHLSESSN